MFDDLRLAVGDLFAPQQRRAAAISLILALAVLIFLWFGVTALLHAASVTGSWWLDTSIEFLGSFAALLLAWLLFPATVLIVMGFFLDRVVTAVEERHYPGLPPPRRIGFIETLAVTLRLAGLAIVFNVILLPFYLFPAINIFIYYALNGYLVGREYFLLVGLRRMDRGAARAVWRSQRGKLVLAGVMIAVLLSLPLINLVAPIIAAAFMCHVVIGLRGTGDRNIRGPVSNRVNR